MSGLQIGFGQDIIVLLVVTILLGSLLAAGVGYISDLYFGDLVASFIGGTGEQDVMLIVKEPSEQAARSQIKQIIASKLPGAEVTSGVKILGRVNFFIKLPARYKSRSIFLKLDNYFSQLPGLESFSLITEPRITIRGLKTKVRSWLEPKVNSLAGVRFTVPDGDKLEVIIKQADKVTAVKQEITDVLSSYQLLSIRFPIASRPDNLFVSAERLVSKLQTEVDYPIVNVTTTQRQNLENLVTTMVEMKKFLQSYASHVKVKLKPNIEVEVEDRLVVPGAKGQQIILRVIEATENKVNSLIVAGDSRQIRGQQAYKLRGEQLGKVVGEVEVDNPRQQLAYAVEQLTVLLPVFRESLQEGQLIIEDVKELADLFQRLKTVTTQLKVANRQLTIYQQQLDTVKLERLRAAVKKADGSLTQIAEIIKQLQFIRDLLTKFTRQLSQAVVRLSTTSQTLAGGSPYQQEVKRLEATLRQLEEKVEQNTTPIITYINRYNPLLQQIIFWQQEIDAVNDLLQQTDNLDTQQFKSLLAKATDQQLITRLEELNTASLGQRLTDLETRLETISRLDIETITEELKYIQQALPQLKDEEITDSIDLIDQYIAGKVIPGEEISLLLPTKRAIDEQLQTKIQQFFPQVVSLAQFQPGVVRPSYRTQLYQILGEVRMILAAVTAVMWTVFSLIFDQTVIILSLQLLTDQYKKRWAVLSWLYGAAVSMIMLSSIFKLARIELPYIPLQVIVLLGGSLGLITASKAEQLSDVSADEFEVGRALGFSYAEIMHQIVIPAGKPGILRLLNKTKTYF